MPAVTAQPVIDQTAQQAVQTGPVDIKSHLEMLGKSYNTGGYGAMMEYVKQNPMIADALRTQPIAQQIVGNPNPKNQNDDHIAVNGIMGAMDTTKQLAQAQKQLGVNVADPNTPAEVKQGLWQRLMSGIQDARAKPGTPAFSANEAYWGALMGGGGYQMASTAYVDVYKTQVAQQNSIALEAAKKQIDFNIKNQDRIALTKSTTDSIGRTLAGEGSNIPVQTIQQVQEQASNILANAQKEPAAAAGAARALVQQLSESGVSEKQLTGVARLLGDVVKLDPNKQKEYDALDKTALSGSGALTRYQFGIASEADNKKINEVLNEIKAKEAARIQKEETEKQTALALAKSQAAMTPVEVPGKPGVFMTPQAIDAQGKVIEATALIPTKVAEQTALIPGKVQEQSALLPGKVKEAGQTAAASAAAKLPFEQQMENFKSALELSTAEAKEYAKTVGSKRGETMAALPSQISSAEQAVTTIGALKESMNSQLIQTNVGVKAPLGSLLSLLPATQSRDFDNVLATLKSQQFLAAVKGMKGLGALSDLEGQRIESAIAKLDKYTSVEQFNKNLDIIQTSLTKMIDENRKFAETGKAGGGNPKPVGGSVEQIPGANTGTTASGNKYKRVQ